MYLLNRDYQKKLLQACYAWYPHSIKEERYIEITSRFFPSKAETDEELIEEALQEMIIKNPERKNLYYLEGHGLIEFLNTDSYEILSKGCSAKLPEIRITPKGIDLLFDDGGLTAIFNTVTVKFDVDTTRELLEAGLISAGIPEEKRSILRSAIEGATTDTIKDLMKAVLKNPVGALDSARNLLEMAI